MSSVALLRPARGTGRLVAAAAAALLLATSAACSRDEAVNPLPTEPVDGVATVDASADWVYYSLQNQSVVSPTNPAVSSEWDIAFFGTNVMLNGGQAGPGDVTGYCLCQNSATNPDGSTVLAYTAESELADFTAVTAATVPAASAFIADDLDPAVTGWYTGSGATAAAATDRAWLVRLRDGIGFAKVRVASIQGASAASPVSVTLEYAVQPTEADALGATDTLTVVVPGSGSAQADILGGAATTSTTDWDIRFEGWTLRLNGGASGPGEVAAYLAEEPFEQITTAVTASQAYGADAFAGVFAQHAWYRYNLTGQHDISPLFDVYLVRRGSDVYRIQITDYYGPAGESRRITLRYTLLTD